MKSMLIISLATMCFCSLTVDCRAEEQPSGKKTENVATAGTSKESDERKWGEPVDGISVSLWSDKTNYRIGDPILVYAQLKNEGKKDFEMLIAHSSLTSTNTLSLFQYYEIKLCGIRPASYRTLDVVLGGEIPLNSLGKRGINSVLESDRRRPRLMTIKPGEKSLIVVGSIDRWYDMSLIGEYSITVSISIGKDENGEYISVSSNELRFKVEYGAKDRLKDTQYEEIRKYNLERMETTETK